MEGVLYHVTCRAELGIPLFQDQGDVDTYLDLLSQYKHQQGFRVYAFTLCAYELHLLLEAGAGATISQIMHALNSRYTKLYCKRYLHAGHLFQGRFRAVVAEKETALLPLIRYLHAQPGSLASSLSLYSDRSQPESWVDLAGTEAGSWKMETESQEMEELRKLLQRPAIGSSAFLEEVKRRASASDIVPAKATGPEEEELVPVRIRRNWQRNGFLAAAMVAGLAGLLSQRAATPLQSKVRMIVESHPAAAQPAQLAVGGSRLISTVPAPYLGGTNWQIQMRPMHGADKEPALIDQLSFQEKRVVSEKLSAKGFSGSNYTLTPQEDGTFIWETMQTGPQGEVICWRGECDGRRMRGVMTRQNQGKETENFIFMSVNPMSET